MTPRTISESTDEPIELEEVLFNLHPDENDAVLFERLIKMSRQLCEQELEQSLVFKTLEVTQDSFCPGCIELPWGPVRSVVSVTYVDTEGNDAVVAADQYRLIQSGSGHFVMPTYGVSWPDARTDVGSVRVRYTAGYPSTDSPPEEVPEPIRQAMHLYIGHYYENREAVLAGSLSELPLGPRHLLNAYRHGLGV